MGIDTGIPTNIKRPGLFSRFRFSSALAGLIPLPSRVLLVGTKRSTGTATAEQPVQVFDVADGDAKAGASSPLANMIRAAFAQAALQGSSPEVWICPVAEPGAGTAHAKTLTVSGPATADGNLRLRINGRPITVGVSNGDSANTIAAALKVAIDAVAAELPVAASVIDAVVTCTHTTKGENGQDVTYSLVEAPAGVGVAFANGASGSGVIDVTNALDNALDRDYDFIAIENRKSADVSDAKAHTAAAWGYQEQKYRWIVMGDPSTLSAANAISQAANDFTVINVGCEACPTPGWELAAAVATMLAAADRPNANYNGTEIVGFAPAPGDAFIASELESALAAGTTPLVPANPNGDRLKVVRLVTTKTTTSSVPDFATYDLATSRVAAFLARQVSARYAQEFSQELLVTDDDAPENVLERIRDMVVGIHRAAEERRIIRDVESFLPQIQVVENPDVAGRVDVANPFRVVSPLHQLACLHHAYL